MKANFFIAGWPKTGSTSLYDYIAQHPDAIVAAKKDSYFFSSDLRASSIAFHGKNRFHFIENMDTYQKLFEHYSNEKVVCESSVFYTISETAATEIYEYNTAAKILIILREPKEMLYSWFNYLKAHTRETAVSLDEAFAIEEQRKVSIDLIPKEVTIPEHVFYRSLVSYYAGIKRFYDKFGKENVKVIFSDDLKSDTLKQTQDVFKFINIDEAFVPEITIKNVTLKTKNTGVKKVIDTTLYPVKVFLRKYSNKGLHAFLRSKYKNLFFTKKAASKEYDETFDNELDNFLKPMLSQTSELIGVDLLKKWNY